jgi:hypothetical protein
MFRNQRSRWTAVLVVALVLLAAMPAAAGGARELRASDTGWWAQAITWFNTLWSGHRASSTKTSSYIDPLGQQSAPAVLASPDSSSSIDPNGQN